MLRFRLLFAAFLLLGAGVSVTLADDYQARQAELKTLRAEISRIEEEIERSREQRAGVAGQLQALERAIGGNARRLHELKAERRDNAARVAALEGERDQRELAIRDQRAYLIQEIRSAYMLGGQQYLKLLLNQENPATLERMLVYFESMGRARNARIQSALADLQALAQVRRALEDERSRLAELAQEQTRQADDLQARRRDRSNLLAALEVSMQQDRGKLERLAADEAALEGLMNKLRDALADIPQGKADRPSLAGQRGRLAWPLEGRIARGYGASRGQDGDETWRGILLAAERGSAVRAVSQGRVVFANWLRGLGLLLIIDHGNGHMTLYGHNDSLYKDIGDWVDAGELIGAAGDTGGLNQAGLYFELRVGGQPQDPLSWLRAESGRDS